MLVKILNEELNQKIVALFEEQLVHTVELLYFYDNNTCDTCEETAQLLEEITALSTKINISKFDLAQSQPIAEKYNINLTPGLVVAGGDLPDPVDYGIRFNGIPSGYEFGSLIQAIIMVSKRDSGLKPGVRIELTKLTQAVHLQVFVTPT